MKKQIQNNRAYATIIIVLLTFIFSSCKKFLDVQPTDAVSDQAAITDNASATNAVRGTYRTLSNSGYYGATFQLDALMSGTELTYTQSSAAELQFLYHTLTADDNDLETIWAAQYAVINQANFIIARVPAVVDPTLTTAYRNQLLGEGYFLRALSYFDLGRTFGNVQLFLTPTKQVSDKYGTQQSSQSQVYTQVLSDLNNAVNLLPDTTTRDRATKKSALALRARLYQYQKQWALAEADASSVIADSGNYKLVIPYSTFFNSVNTTESIFEISYSLSYPNPEYSNWKKGGNYLPDDSIITLLQNPAIGGNRNSLLTTSGGTVLGNLYPLSNGTNPVYVIRIAELWLLRAEARAQQGANLSGALSDLNAVRARAGVPLATDASQAGLLLAIENERRVEFAFEPHRWFDLVRTGRAATVFNVSDTTQYLYPIPTPELQADHSLVQNPGYH